VSLVKSYITTVVLKQKFIAPKPEEERKTLSSGPVSYVLIYKFQKMKARRRRSNKDRRARIYVLSG